MEPRVERELYQNAPDPDGYRAASGRPASRKEEPYAPVRLGTAPAKRRNQVLLFTVEVIEPGETEPWTYEGAIEDPVPARHYAQMLLDVTEIGTVAAQATMLNNVLGEENMRRLAACEALEPDDLIKIMSQVAARAMGPYEDALGK